MQDLMATPAFRTYSICCSILVLKLFWSAVYTGVQRQRSQAYANAEDARVFGASGAQAALAESPAVALGLRIQRNDAENLPAFFAIGLVFVLGGASPRAAAIYLWTFTFARVLHTVFYTRHMQPWRAISFLVGALAVVGMAVQTLIACF
jgi:glutathione S-transferase